MKNQNYSLTGILFLMSLMFISLTVPIVMLDAPIWLIAVIGALIYSPIIFASGWLTVVVGYGYHLARPVLYICALIVTIQGKQDFLAIAFYILMGLQIISIIKGFLGTVFVIYSSIVLKDK